MSQAMLQAVILAGGLATRLKPVTQSIPKALIMIHDKPFIHHQLSLLKRNGFERIVLCIGYLGEMIMDYLDDSSYPGLSITYSHDGKQLLGTAGAIKNAFDHLDEQFFVLYGDSYLDCEYRTIQQHFIESKKHGLMTVYQNNSQFDKSNVLFKNAHIIRYEKTNQNQDMQYIDYGLSLFDKSAFDIINSGKQADLSEVHQHLLANQDLAAYEVNQRFYEIGSFSGIKDLENYLQTSIAI